MWIYGNIIIPFQYDRADNFYNSIAEVKIDENCYLIDKKGKEYIVGKCEFFGEFMPEVEIEE